MSLEGSGANGRVFRGAIVALVVATCVRVWIGPAGFIPEARAQIPDAGSQRHALTQETRRTNQLLTEILTTLRKGTLKVELRGTDNKDAPSVRRQSRRSN